MSLITVIQIYRAISRDVKNQSPGIMNGLYTIQSRPYLAEATNATNETHFGPPVPVRVGLNSVLVAHGQQRNVYDTTNTSVVGQNGPNPFVGVQPQTAVPYGPYVIVGQPQALQQQILQPPAPLASYMFPAAYQPCPSACPCCPAQGNPFCSPIYRQVTADGVDFGFGPQQPSACGALPPQTEYLRTQYDQLSMQQQIALKQLEKHSLETMLLQEQLKRNPFLLQFHHDKHTSTEDLLHAVSQARPDMPAAAAQHVLDGDADVFHHSVRQLRLTKSPDLQYSSNGRPRSCDTCNGACSVRAEEATQTKPKVNFEVRQSFDDMFDAAESLGDQTRDADAVQEFSVEKPSSSKTKNENAQYSDVSSIKYSVQEPDDGYQLDSTDDRDGSSNSKESNCSDTGEVPYKRMGGRRPNRKPTKKQSRKKGR